MPPDNPQAADDTIAAISTPPGTGAIAVVRLSGPGSLALADRVFRGGVTLSEVPPRTVHRGHVLSGSGDPIDEVLATTFSAPRSYTGEDMVEFSCHGGPLPAALVLDALLEAGARAAGPGEFTKRAYLSGRIDLSQAEAVAQIIAAKSRAGLKAALAQVGGALSERVRGLRRSLVEVLAEIEARLDFAEDIDEPIDRERIRTSVVTAVEDLKELLASGELGRLAVEGARVVIAGRPNVGKSKLLNAIVGKDRAIVTPVPGTTRDTIEEWVELDGVLLTLADTAGLRPSTDVVEVEGVRRARMLIRDSQLVLGVLELPSLPVREDLAMIEELAREAPVIPVLNKSDLGGDSAAWERALGAAAPERDAGSHRVLPPAVTSALTRDGVTQLKRRIVECLTGRTWVAGAPAVDAGEVLLTNARHIEALRRALEALDRAGDGLAGAVSEEILAFEVGQALGALGEITGESAAQEVIETIFSRFCVGK